MYASWWYQTGRLMWAKRRSCPDGHQSNWLRLHRFHWHLRLHEPRCYLSEKRRQGCICRELYLFWRHSTFLKFKKTTTNFEGVGFSSFQTGGKFRSRIVCRSEINCQKCPYSIFYTGDEETSVNIETIGGESEATGRTRNHLKKENPKLFHNVISKHWTLSRVNGRQVAVIISFHLWRVCVMTRHWRHDQTRLSKRTKCFRRWISMVNLWRHAPYGQQECVPLEFGRGLC